MPVKFMRIAVGVLVAVIAWGQASHAQEGAKEGSPQPSEVKEIALSLTPAAAPTPAFRYRLLPWSPS